MFDVLIQLVETIMVVAILLSILWSGVWIPFIAAGYVIEKVIKLIFGRRENNHK